MSPDRRLLAARIVFALYLAAVIWLCFGQFDGLPDVERSFWGIPTDKIAHFLMFFPFPVLAYYAFDRYSPKFPVAILWTLVAFLAGILIAAGTELGQARLTSYRSGDILDFRADLLSLGISTFFVLLLNLRKLRK